MSKTVLQLYPESAGEIGLEGLYLQHNLHQLGTAAQPVVYANFITSLDGRIGVPKPGTQTHQVPPTVANSRDWRLYQELAAQADLLITSARYFRQLESGDAQDTLPVGQHDAYSDLRQWRIEQGLTPQPAVAILSSSLNIPLAALQAYRDRSLFVVTGATADQQRVGAIEAEGIRVLMAGPGNKVTGKGLLQCLTTEGFRSLYAIAGPQVLHTLTSAGVLNRLYLTVAHRLLGGREFDTLAWGESLHPPADFSLYQLYYDPHGPAGTGQWLSVYEAR